MMKLGRNDPCWCGSGKKYKKCHLYRQDQKKVTPFDIGKKFKKHFGKEYCIYLDRSECRGSIVKAHTIQRNGSLNKIADNGQVLLLLAFLQRNVF